MTTNRWPPGSDEQYRRQAVADVGEQLAAAFGRVRICIFDADGVLTPGNLIYGPNGEALKEFNTQDGLGLVMAREAGVKLAVLTGRNSEIVARRAGELGFAAIKLGRFDKLAALREILAETECDAKHALYMGDDLIDIPALMAVSVSVAVPEAPPEVKATSRYITAAGGGRGAVREVTDLVLRSSGLYGDALVRITESDWGPRVGSKGPAGGKDAP